MATLDGSRALATWEGDPTVSTWIDLDARVQLFVRERRVPAAAPESWILVLGPTQTYSSPSQPRWIAMPGERYRVVSQDSGWVLAIWEGDPPNWPVWLELDVRFPSRS